MGADTLGSANIDLWFWKKKLHEIEKNFVCSGWGREVHAWGTRLICECEVLNNDCEIQALNIMLLDYKIIIYFGQI